MASTVPIGLDTCMRSSTTHEGAGKMMHLQCNSGEGEPYVRCPGAEPHHLNHSGRVGAIASVGQGQLLMRTTASTA